MWNFTRCKTVNLGFWKLLTYPSTDLTLGSLSSDVFERRTSTGSEPFSLVISLYATVFVLPSVLILKGTICPKICSKARLKCAKSLFPVDVRRSKTSLLKLPINTYFSLKAKCWLRGGVGGSFPGNFNSSAIFYWLVILPASIETAETHRDCLTRAVFPPCNQCIAWVPLHLFPNG